MNKLVLPITQPKKTLSLIAFRARKKSTPKEAAINNTATIVAPEPIVAPVETTPEPQKTHVEKPAFVEILTPVQLQYICAFLKLQILNGEITDIRARDKEAIAQKQAILSKMDTLLSEVDTLIQRCSFEALQGMCPVRFGKDGFQQSDLTKLRALRIASAGKVKNPSTAKPSKAAKK